MKNDGSKDKSRITPNQAGRAIEQLRQKAEALAKDPALVSRLLEAASSKAADQKTQIQSLGSNLFGLIRLLKSWATGQYRKVPWSTLVMGVSGILYFVNPLDIIPDFILGAGYLDDAAVLAMILRAIKGDVDEYRKWEDQPK